MMTLTVFPDGKLLLAVEAELDDVQYEAMQLAFRAWKESEHGVAIIAGCRVEHATTVDLVLPEPKAPADCAYRTAPVGRHYVGCTNPAAQYREPQP